VVRFALPRSESFLGNVLEWCRRAHSPLFVKTFTTLV
jgi:hypothetical protein